MDILGGGEAVFYLNFQCRQFGLLPSHSFPFNLIAP